MQSHRNVDMMQRLKGSRPCTLFPIFSCCWPHDPDCEMVVARRLLPDRSASLSNWTREGQTYTAIAETSPNCVLVLPRPFQDPGSGGSVELWERKVEISPNGPPDSGVPCCPGVSTRFFAPRAVGLPGCWTATTSPTLWSSDRRSSSAKTH